jgi:hypothetical protein
MKVQFEFTVQDLAEVASKHASASRVVSASRWNARALWAAMIGIAAFGIVPTALIGRTLAGLAAFTVSILVWKKPGTQSPNPVMVKYYREQLGSDGPFTCEVELCESDFRTRQFGTETVHPWSHVASIELVPEGIEFRIKPMGLVLVRDRAFATSQNKELFLQRARELQMHAC